MESIAEIYARSERVIICYGMGVTQHRHGTGAVQQIANLLLLRGNFGREGAGICPLRGHSNVQGDRTVGITELPGEAFLARLDRSEEHTSELQSLMRTSYAVFCLKKKIQIPTQRSISTTDNYKSPTHSN